MQDVKYFYSVFLIFVFSFLHTQKLKVVDIENGKPLSNVRILQNSQVYYTNDDGEVLLPENSAILEISAFGYQTEKNKKYNPLIKLKPLYTDIDEVKIVSVDVKKIFNDIADRYSEIYYDKPAIYEVTIKQRSFENNEMKLLMIADGKFWSRDGMYNAKEAFNNKFSNFVQLQIDNLRYLKSEPYENFIRMKKQDSGHDYIGNMFFHYEIFGMIGLTKMKKALTTGRLLYENDDEKQISYSIKTDKSLFYKGEITYNKKDKAITHFVMNFSQSNSEPFELKDENEVKYKRQLGDGIISFDFYKNGEKYVPSKISIKSEGFKTITDTKIFEFRSAREIIFKNFYPTDKKGVENPVEINKSYWNNMKVSEDKGEVLLTKEEEQFINEKSDEE